MEAPTEHDSERSVIMSQKDLLSFADASTYMNISPTFLLERGPTKLIKGQTKYWARDPKFVQTFSYGTARPHYSQHQLLRSIVQ